MRTLLHEFDWLTCRYSQDLDQDDYLPDIFQEVDFKTIEWLHKQEAEKRKKRDKTRARLLHRYGFEGDHLGDAILG